jgi:hypothetical protein
MKSAQPGAECSRSHCSICPGPNRDSQSRQPGGRRTGVQTARNTQCAETGGHGARCGRADRQRPGITRPAYVYALTPVADQLLSHAYVPFRLTREWMSDLMPATQVERS